jgi:pentatricopeptide repeat protein
MTLPPLISETPLVSVIMFCRNRVCSIRRAVESVLAQSYPNWELIIQDGASTDGTREAIEAYTHDARIKLVSEKDTGPFDAMWRAYRRAQGELFGSCLSDEELYPHALSEGVNYFRFNQSSAAILRDVDYTDITGKVIQRSHGDEFNFLDYLAMQFSLALCSMLFRRTALQDLDYLSRNWRFDCADFELLTRLGERHQIDYYPGVVAKYTQFHEDQLSTNLELSFVGAQGQMQFIHDFFGESPPEKIYRHLRPFPLIVTYKKLRQRYLERGATELAEKLSRFMDRFDLNYGVTPRQLACEAIEIGALDLAKDLLADIPTFSEDYAESLRLQAEIFTGLGQTDEAWKFWEKMREQGFPGAEDGRQKLHEKLQGRGAGHGFPVWTDLEKRCARRLDERMTFTSWAPGAHLHGAVLEAWAKILQLLPQARLLLVNPDLRASDARRYLRTFFKQHGIGPESLLLLPGESDQLSVSMVAQTDIYLDTFPYSDTLGLSYAVSQGVTSVVREAAETTGLPSRGPVKWVTTNTKSYIVTAVKLAKKTKTGK